MTEGFECGMWNAEFGIGNAEFGKKKRRQIAEVIEFGIGNAEFGRKKEDR
jgi:hypothetical protein